MKEMTSERFKNHFNEVLSGISENGRQLTQDEVVKKLNKYHEENQKLSKSVVNLTLCLQQISEKVDVYLEMIERGKK